MGFCELKGQHKARELLENGLKSERIAHAYMFYGPGGVGKNKAAVLFAQALNCTAANSERPCGHCLDCRKISSSNHPDIIQIAPEGMTLKIAQIRSLQEKAFYKCYEGTTKVIIVDGADKMTLEAANSLLRILEEPPERTIFILLVEELGKLPATIHSRCQAIPFLPLEDRELLGLLHEQGLSTTFPLSFAKGSVGKALEMQQNKEMAKALTDTEMLLEDLRAGSYNNIFIWAENLEKNKELIELMVDILNTYYRDRILILFGVEDNLLLDTLPDKDYRIEECYEALDILNKAMYMLQSNANTRLVLEVTLIRLRNIEQKNRMKGENPHG